MTQEDRKFIVGQLSKLATKEEVAKLATKEEIANLVTKKEIANLATKEEVSKLATRDEIVSMEERLEKKIETEIEHLAQVTQAGFAEVHKRIDGVEANLGGKIDDLAATVNEHTYGIGRLKSDVDELKQHTGLVDKR